MSKPTKDLFEVATRLFPVVWEAILEQGDGHLKMERVNSGFEFDYDDDFLPVFKNKKQSVAVLAELASIYGVNNETIRETANYNGKIPSESGLAGWEWSALLRIFPDKVREKYAAGS